MNKHELEILGAIYYDLNNYQKFGFYSQGWSGEMIFSTVLTKTSRSRIAWIHCGSSSEPNTLEGLQYIIAEVFEMQPSEFIETYTRV